MPKDTALGVTNKIGLARAMTPTGGIKKAEVKATKFKACKPV